MKAASSLEIFILYFRLRFQNDSELETGKGDLEGHYTAIMILVKVMEMQDVLINVMCV